MKEDLVLEFSDLASRVNISYLEYESNWPNELRERFKREAFLILDDFSSNNPSATVSQKTEKLNSLKRELVREYAKGAEERGERCPFELREISRLVGLFSKMYDLTDPRAYVVVKAVISQSLVVLRLERYTHETGTIVTKIDKHGNVYKELSSVEFAKRAFHESLLKAVTHLDSIFEGQKITVSTVTPKDLITLFSTGTELSQSNTHKLNRNIPSALESTEQKM